MRWFRSLLVVGVILGASAPLTPAHAQRGGASRPEPAKPAPPAGPSFVVPTLVGVGCAAAIILVVCLPGRKPRQRDGKP